MHEVEKVFPCGATSSRYLSPLSILPQHLHTKYRLMIILKCLNRGRVDAHGDVSNHPLGNIFTICRNDRYNGIEPSFGTILINGILRIGDTINFRVKHIRLQAHNLLRNRFIKVELSSANSIAGNDRAIFSDPSVSMRLNVYMNSTLYVEPYSAHELVLDAQPCLVSYLPGKIVFISITPFSSVGHIPRKKVVSSV